MGKYLKETKGTYKIELTQNKTDKDIEYEGFTVKPNMWYGTCLNTGQKVASEGKEKTKFKDNKLDVYLLLSVKEDNGKWKNEWINEDPYECEFICHVDGYIDFQTYEDKIYDSENYDLDYERIRQEYVDKISNNGKQPIFYIESLPEADKGVVLYYYDDNYNYITEGLESEKDIPEEKLCFSDWLIENKLEEAYNDQIYDKNADHPLMKVYEDYLKDDYLPPKNIEKHARSISLAEEL